MAIHNSLSIEAINEFKSRITDDRTLPDNLKEQLTALINQGKWQREISVSEMLEAVCTELEEKPDDKA
jgi:hypothetical protein